VATKANIIHIHELERNNISLGVDPKTMIFVGYLIKNKDNEIKVLKKKINIHDVQHVQTLEL